MTPDMLCIECNWDQTGPFAPIALILASLGVLLGWLAFMLSGLPDFLQQLSEDLGFEGDSSYHGDRAARTGRSVAGGAAAGAMGTAIPGTSPAPPSGPPTSVPPPPGAGGPGIGQQFWDIVGEDLSKLGRQ